MDRMVRASVAVLSLAVSVLVVLATEPRPTMLLDGNEEASLRKEVRGKGRIYFKSQAKLYVVHPDGSGLKVVRDFGTEGRSPRYYSVSWDGEWIAISLQVQSKDKKLQELWVIRHDGSQARKVFELQGGGYPKDMFPAWSPDDKWLIFTQGKELSVVNVETEVVRSLMKITKGEMREVTWSRNWKLLFNAGKNTLPHTLQLDENCNPVGEPLRIGGYIGCRKKLSPDGKKILIIKEQRDWTHRVWLRDPVPGAELGLLPIEWGIDGLVLKTRSQDDCCWSPDGKYIAYLHTPVKEKLKAAGIEFTGPKVLCVCRREGGPQIWVTDGTPKPSWPIWGAEPKDRGSE